MPFQINIFNMKNNALNNIGNIALGFAVHNSHTANSKWVGSNMTFGDLSPTGSISTNGVLDDDIFDQDQVSNPSFPNTNQF